jgi:hypothetical protein
MRGGIHAKLALVRRRRISSSVPEAKFAVFASVSSESGDGGGDGGFDRCESWPETALERGLRVRPSCPCVRSAYVLSPFGKDNGSSCRRLRSPATTQTGRLLSALGRWLAITDEMRVPGREQVHADPSAGMLAQRLARQVVAVIRLAQGRSQSRADRDVRKGAAAVPLTAAIATWSRHRRSQAVAAPPTRWNPPATQSTMRLP